MSHNGKDDMIWRVVGELLLGMAVALIFRYSDRHQGAPTHAKLSDNSHCQSCNYRLNSLSLILCCKTAKQKRGRRDSVQLFICLQLDCTE